MTAVDTIRASIAALSEGLRAHHWDSDYGLVLSSRYGTGGEVVADCLPGHLVEPGQQKETARHIALLASPDVATALADLLDAVAAMETAYRRATTEPTLSLDHARQNVYRSRDVLERAIAREAT